METILGFSHMSWLIVLCSTLHVAFQKEKPIASGSLSRSYRTQAPASTAAAATMPAKRKLVSLALNVTPPSLRDSAPLEVASAMAPSMNGTSVENFSCIVRSYTFKNPTMNCTWNAGTNAPSDTQYFMYLAYHKATDNECPHYISNMRRRHIGCYFPDVIVNKYRVNITVNGSSTKSPIQSYVDDFRLYKKEQLRPPQNITVDYKSPLYYRIQWEPPPSSRKVGRECFEFQIKDECRNTVMNVTGKTYFNFAKPAKYILRIRTIGHTVCTISKEMNGEWSEPIEFGTDPDTFPTLPLVFAALGTMLIIMLLTLICKRNHIWEKLTDPVPQPKDIMWQHEKNVEKWVTPVPIGGESITVVEEMTAISPKV